MKVQSKAPQELAFSSEKNQRIFNFLKSHPIGVLATVDPNGDPHATTVYFSVDNEFKVSFVTKRDTKKFDNLQHNDRAMFVVFDAWTQAVVQVVGSVKDISDTPEAQVAFQDMLAAAIHTSESGVPPISKLYAGYYATFQIQPAQIRMAMFMRPSSGGYDMYETIDF